MADHLSPADIDAFRIEGYGRLVGRIGLTLTFYLPRPHDTALRAAVAQCIEEYRGLVRGQLKQAIFKSRMMPEAKCPMAGKLVRGIVSERKAFWVLFTGADNLKNVSHYNLETFLPGRVSYERIGELAVTFPLSDIAARPPGFFQQLAERWCRILSPVHGYGGFSVMRSIDPAYAESAEPFLYPIVGRFPGLEIDTPAAHILHCFDGFKSVNWLTILSSPLVEKVGGRAHLERVFSDGKIAIRDYGAGVLIQAGPYPQLGDATLNDVPVEYQRVYRAVKAAQSKYEDIIMRTPSDVDPRAFAQRWLHRFE